MRAVETTSSTSQAERALERWAEPLGAVAEALSRVRFGAILLTVHDGKVQQVDVTERRRFGN